MNKVQDSVKVKAAEEPSRLQRRLLGLLSGTFLSKDKVLQHTSFIFFLVALAITYIAYGYHAESTVKHMYELERDVKELKAQDLTLKSELEQVKQQSNVAEAIQELGLQESRIQPFKIVREKQQ